MQHAPFYLKLSQDDSWYMDRPHFHESVEFLLPVSHGGQMFVENQVYDLAPGTMFVLPDATLHKTLSSDGEEEKCLPYERYVLHVPLTTLRAISTPKTDLYQRVLESGRMVTLGESYEALLRLLQRLDRSQEEEERFGGDILQMNLLSEFLVEALSAAPRREDSAAPMSVEQHMLTRTREGTLRIDLVLAYLQEHMAEKLTLDQIAAEFYISKYYLSHCFKAATGFSVGQYLINTRILEARRMLQDGGRVAQVGEAVGFHSNEHFIRTFTKLTGISPKQYARQFSGVDKQ
ncbi:MAG: helix-turn-helix transcriptional regulator [Oscillibacter sp.]|nr:helix-turn-helix transcriptional regulator [Oscillibacter sp.]MBQ2996626.1 helix-turn-helix transcriptional regulator [Oscillibacter sp.]